MERFHHSAWADSNKRLEFSNLGIGHVTMLISAELNPRRELWDMLNAAGARDLWQVQNGAEARAIYQQHGAALDLLILDVDFPAADAAALIDYFYDRRFTLPVALLGNRNDVGELSTESRCRAHRLNTIGLYPKPLTAPALRSMMLKSNGRPRLRKVVDNAQ